MSHGHFKTMCNCGKVINQCRCMSPNKTVKIEGCEGCKKKPINPTKDILKMSNFKLALGKTYEETLTQRKVSITTIKGGDNQFIGYKYDIEPGERWLVKEEFRQLFTPLSKVTIEERVHILGSTVADINVIVKHYDKAIVSPDEMSQKIKAIIEQCAQELKSD